MKKLLKNLFISLFSLFLILSPITARAFEGEVFKDIPSSKAANDLRMAERRLWIDHVLWSRSFIVSDLASLEDKDPVLERLLKNQDDIGNSIKPYYGENAGNTLSALLREHIEIAGQVTNAAKSGNKADLEKYNKIWYENADKIADFLSSANPNYSNQTLKNMLHKHLEFLTAQVIGRLNKNWKADISAFDKGEDHMIMFSDILIDGIVKQFPQKF